MDKSKPMSTNSCGTPKANVNQSDQAVHKPDLPKVPPKTALKSIMIFDSDNEESILNQVDHIANNMQAVAIKHNAAEKILDFNNEAITALSSIDQQANVQHPAIHPPLTEPILPTNQEQLSSTPIPAFDTPTSNLNRFPEMHIVSKLKVNGVIEITKSTLKV